MENDCIFAKFFIVIDINIFKNENIEKDTTS